MALLTPGYSLVYVASMWCHSLTSDNPLVILLSRVVGGAVSAES